MSIFCFASYSCREYVCKWLQCWIPLGLVNGSPKKFGRVGAKKNQLGFVVET